jgi:hypothetical protein
MTHNKYIKPIKFEGKYSQNICNEKANKEKDNINLIIIIINKNWQENHQLGLDQHHHQIILEIIKYK